MLILGYAGHQRHGWSENPERKLASRLRHARRHSTLFDAISSFGEEVEDLPMNLFPLDGVGHDGSAAILRDGTLLAAAAEERFNRLKHSTAPGGRTLPPSRAPQYCLAEAGASIQEVEHIAVYCDFTPDALQARIGGIEPHLRGNIRERVLSGYRAVYAGTVSNQRVAQEVMDVFDGHARHATLHFVPHHLAHAASAFYSSGYAESGILTIDGFGEKSSSIFALGGPDGIRVIEETMLPGSLGVLYLMMTAFLGFKPLDGEYKVMGLASYGNPAVYSRQFDELFERQADGSCLTTALVSGDFGERIKSLFGPPRAPRDPVTRHEMDIAAALQKGFEDAVLFRLDHLRARYGCENICLAGGSALNVVMTGKLARSGIFRRTYVFPAAGDDGTSVGAAQYVQHQLLRRPPSRKRLRSMSLGPRYSEEAVVEALHAFSGKVTFRREEQVEEAVAEALAQGKVVGWFRGRMEFGPRALGNRSILADPRSEGMRDVVNQRVKLREEFRPFAPAALAESADAYFDMTGVGRSDFMEFVVPARELGRQQTQAVVHFDGSARIQTVTRKDNESFWQLISAFARRTGVPVVLNTSFNVRGEPIVCSPRDAIRCFLSTQIDLLALESYLVSKTAGHVLEEDMAVPALDD
jgi:carbamoyltransferase